MGVLLWILQILLALWNITGAVFTVFNYENLKSGWASSLPRPVWFALCGLQALGALGLVLPGVTGGSHRLTAIAAGYLAANALFGCALFTQYGGFPGMLWGVGAGDLVRICGVRENNPLVSGLKALWLLAN